jgi:hypothetical protein
MGERKRGAQDAKTPVLNWASGGEGKEGGPVGGAMWRTTEGGGPGPTAAAGGRHRPWNSGCGWHVVHGAAKLHG